MTRCWHRYYDYIGLVDRFQCSDRSDDADDPDDPNDDNNVNDSSNAEDNSMRTILPQKIHERRKTYPVQSTQLTLDTHSPIENYDNADNNSEVSIQIETVRTNSAVSVQSTVPQNRLHIFNSFNPFQKLANAPFALRKKRLKSIY